MPRPIIIAHRGASGYLPEHTLVAKALAVGLGADFLEQDVVATRDGELLVFHDLVLEQTTDVQSVFPGRARADGHFYCIDFTLEEIRALTVRARRKAAGEGLRYPHRFPDDGGRFPIPTLEEEIRFVQGLNKAMGRIIGIYPEIKHPQWHRQQGIELGEMLLETLERFGYRAADDAIYLQCFDAVELRRLRERLGCQIRLVQLISDSMPVPGQPELEQISTYASVIGPPIELIYRGRDPHGSRPIISSLVSDARAAGLAVHPYTFRADDLPADIVDHAELLDMLLHRLCVDGLFTDFPDLVATFLNEHSSL